ncbi:hypothetical protein CJA_1879 [Cellvibrio japonicus Ueda107]|uniref:Uncharacterized protein n=1 Tax=Cellvibrio japonicus (strain Ueda107) TaxID=498211 RepID=B3PGM8_CELJU|nr:hypothetical protein CJA_1879 [Cellvibrio japonicus Ueda107]
MFLIFYTMNFLLQNGPDLLISLDFVACICIRSLHD